MADISDNEVTVTEKQKRRIRERVLQAEKAKLHMDLPRGIINEVEDIVREEID
jgi:hypothetical protein